MAVGVFPIELLAYQVLMVRPQTGQDSSIYILDIILGCHQSAFAYFTHFSVLNSPWQKRERTGKVRRCFPFV